jgi:hypothetical protein
MSQKQVHRDRRWQPDSIGRRSRLARRRGPVGLVGLKSERHAGLVKPLNGGGSHGPVYDAGTQTVTNPELEDRSYVSHPVVIWREAGFIFFKK